MSITPPPLPPWLPLLEKTIRLVVPKAQRMRVLNATRKRIFNGTAVACPCCGQTYSRFLPFGKPQRPYARCPGCNALERHRLVWLFLQQATALFTPQPTPLRVLHMAPENILQSLLKPLPHLNYLSADLAAPNAMVHFDITAIPYPEASFDVVLCNHVLEHIPDDRQAMRELFRVLAPGGWAVLDVPLKWENATTDEDPSVTDPAERERRFGQDDHVRWYGRDYLDRLAEVGFVVHQWSPNDAANVTRFGLPITPLVWVSKPN